MTGVRVAALAAGLVAALAVVAVVHLGLGASGVGLADLTGLLDGSAPPAVRDVLLGARLPRTLAGLVVGLALGVGGALVQGATRNPLAAPDTLGVNAGAFAAVTALAVSGVGGGLLATGGAAMAGALAAALLVLGLTSGGVATPGRVLLAGAAITLVGSAVAAFLQILDEQNTASLFFWGNGTLLQAGLARPVVLGVAVLVVLAGTPLLARPLDLLALGDPVASAMGVPVARIRVLALGVTVLLAALAVTLAGPIGFVGLVAPVAVRALGVRRHAALLPLAGLGGAVLLLGADAGAQLVAPPTAGFGELPAGVVTALLGGPVFVLLARRVVTGDADTGAAVVTGPRRPVSLPLVLGVLTAVLVAAAVLALRVGDVAVSWSAVLAALSGGGDALGDVVVGLRLPRVLVGALAGACLAVAGVAVQAVVRNPLAEPQLLGITGGASVGAVGLLALAPAAPAAALPVAAGVGAVLALALVVVASGSSRGPDPTRVVLVGLGVAATTAAAVTLLVVSSRFDLASALTWLSGTTYGRGTEVLGWLVLPVLAGTALVLAARPTDLLALGEDVPRALGLSPARVRLGVLGAAALLAGGSAAAVGTVGFVGLVAPHLARAIVGPATGRLVPVAAVLGALLVVVADVVGRSLLAPAEIPTGVVTALVGAPYLVWLLRRGTARG